MMNKTLEIQFHLQCAVPVLKSEHRSPVQPEGGIENFFVKNIFDGLIIQVLILRHEEFHNLHAAFLAQIEFSVRMRIFSPFISRPAKRVIGVALVQPVIFVQNGCSRNFKRRDAPE